VEFYYGLSILKFLAVVKVRECLYLAVTAINQRWRERKGEREREREREIKRDRQRERERERERESFPSNGFAVQHYLRRSTKHSHLKLKKKSNFLFLRFRFFFVCPLAFCSVFFQFSSSAEELSQSNLRFFVQKI